MTTPRGIFIDTCVFERQHFDFSTTAITSFAKIADEMDLKLLVPRATEHEITKHLKAKARDALQGLQKTARTAPFLKGWKQLSASEWNNTTVAQIERQAVKEWHRFKARFEVQTLGYEEVALPDVMNW